MNECESAHGMGTHQASHFETMHNLWLYVWCACASACVWCSCVCVCIPSHEWNSNNSFLPSIFLHLHSCSGGCGICSSLAWNGQSSRKTYIKHCRSTGALDYSRYSQRNGRRRNKRSDPVSSISFSVFMWKKSSYWVYSFLYWILRSGAWRGWSFLCNLNVFLFNGEVIIKRVLYAYLSDMMVIFFRSIQPLCLGGLVMYFSQLPTPENGSQSTIALISKAHAYWYAGGILTCAFISMLVNTSFVLYTIQMGLRIHLTCRSMVYKKVL